MTQPVLEIYYADVCTLCHKAMDYFDAQNIPYTKHQLVWDEAADAFEDSETSRALYERLDDRPDFVPQIFVGDTHIPGWRKLEPMIEDGSFQALLGSSS